MASNPAEIAYQTAHIRDNRGPELVATTIVFMSLTCLAVAGRLYARRVAKVGFGADDYIIAAALFFECGMCIEMFLLVHYGYGKHAVTLTPNKGEMISKVLFAFELTFPFVNFLAKASLLAFYTRIFGKGPTWFRIGWWANAVWLLGLFVGFFILILTQCKPISAFWKPQTQNLCRLSYNPALVILSMNAISDAAILMLPMPMVWSLHLPQKQKIATCGLFLLGSLAVVVSIIRIPVLRDGATGIDASYAAVPSLIWSIAEPTVGIICVCAPIMRPLFMKRPKTTFDGSKKQWTPIKSPQYSQANNVTSYPGTNKVNEGSMNVHVRHDVELDYSLRDMESPGAGLGNGKERYNR